MDGVPYTKPCYFTRVVGDRELLYKVEEDYVPGVCTPVRVRGVYPDGRTVEGHAAVREMLGVTEAEASPVVDRPVVEAAPAAVADEQVIEPEERPPDNLPGGRGLSPHRLREIAAKINAERLVEMQNEALTWTNYKPWEETREVTELSPAELKVRIAWLEECRRQKLAEGFKAADGAPRCQFVKSSGDTCGSPALRNRHVCYFHQQTGAGRRKSRKIEVPSALKVPVLEDEQALQLAVTRVCRGIADESLETKRASTLLYGLQVALSALRKRATKSAISND